MVSFPWLRTGFVPTAHKQNNELMLKIARHLLDLKRELGRELTQLEVRRLIEEWFELTPAQFRSHPVDHYHMELLRAIGNAKVPLSTNPLAFAVVAAKQNTRPEWIQELPAIEPLRLIAAVCLELAGINGGGTFFVSSYQLGEAIDIPQRTAHHHLKVLIGAKRLKLVTQGTRNAANEYRLTV